ncbi:MAG: hypothetical protein NTX82_03990 [Candidatus Parcubacteria bacterium]|nr:hypothetical protein [Candidatus Parcubacteria bacterium]
MFKSLYYTDLKNPSEIVKLFNGSEHHFDLNPNFFFNSTGDKLLYQSFFIDEFSGSVTLTEYDLAAKKANIINSIGFSCDNDANCSGNDDIKGDSIIPLGYAMSDGQEAVFYAVKEDDKYIVYKNDKPFTRFNNAPIEITPELMGVPRVSRNGDNIYYLMDNKELHLATLGSSLEVKTQAGPHTYDFLLVSSDLPGPHGGINSQYQVSPFSDHVLYVNSSGAEGWLELKLYSLENSEKKLIDSLEFDENNL